MKKHFLEKIFWFKKKKTKLAPLALIIAAFLSLVAMPLFAGRIVTIVSDWSLDSQVEKIYDGLERELIEVIRQKDEIVADQEIIRGLASKDSDNLYTLTQKKRAATGLSCLVTDAEGFVISRTLAKEEVGDNIFYTPIYGRSLGQRGYVAGIYPGTRNSLMIMAGSNVISGGDIVGSIVVGHSLTDAYSIQFKQKYLDKRTEVIFYSTKDGVTGETFGDEKISSKVRAYFGLDSKILQENLEIISDEMIIDGDFYAARHILYPNDEGFGGMIVFFPINFFKATILITLISILLFFIFSFLLLYFFQIDLMKLNKRHWSLIMLGLAVWFALSYSLTSLIIYFSANNIDNPPYMIYNSVIRIYPDNDTIKKSAEKIVAIKVETGGEAINAVKASLGYNPNQLEVVEIITERSFCNPAFFLEKKIDNELGRVDVTCGVLNPGFQGAIGTVAEILFRPKQVGSISLNFLPDTMVLANDGLGTNVLRMVTDGHYQVVEPEGLIGGWQTEGFLPIFSESHPNSNRWYSGKEISFSWPSVNENDIHYYFFSNQPELNSQADFKKVDGHVLNLRVPEDGIYYLFIKSYNSLGEERLISSFRVMIDSVPPTPPKILVSSRDVKRGELVRFDFTTSDSLSGLQSEFYIKVGGNTFFPVQPPFYLPFVSKGNYQVTLKAFDRANNSSESSINIRVR